MAKEKLLVVDINGEKRAIIPVVKADLKLCKSCGYQNGGICLRKPKIMENINKFKVGISFLRNCKNNNANTLH